MNTRSRTTALAACLASLGLLCWAQARQVVADGPDYIDTPVLPQNPTTHGNAPARVRAALKLAREAQAKHDQDISNAPEVTRLREVPSITLPLLAPYAVHPNESAREIVYMVAADALTGQSILSQPVDENTRDLAMRLLAQVSTFRAVSAPAAVQSLYDLVIAGSLPGYTEPPNLVERYAKAGVKRGLMRYVENVGPDEEAAALLSLFHDDAQVGKFLARMAKRHSYPFAFSLALAQWNDGNALEAVEHELKTMKPEDLAGVADRIRFIDHPQVLRLLALHLDDRRETHAIGFPVAADADLSPFMRHVCDHILAALKIKLEGAKIDLREPDIATDDELAAAKQRFGPLIDALPTPNAPPA